MTKITPRAKDRCERKSLQEQLEDARRQMQRESGASDMRTIDAHLRHDTLMRTINRICMPIDGSD